MANTNGVNAKLTRCSFSKNQGEKGSKNIANDRTSSATDSVSSLANLQPADESAPEPKAATPVKPKPMEKRKLEDVFLHNTDHIKVKLRSMVSQQNYTVLTLCDLTDPDFISSYRSIEAAALDYTGKGVKFFYIYRYLTHPENNNYIQPFILRERVRQSRIAADLLHTRISWLCDGMDNQAAKALEYDNNNLFIFNKEGVEEYSGMSDDEADFRKALTKLAGTPETRTPTDSIAGPDIKPVFIRKSTVAPRVSIRPNQDTFRPLQITPINSRFPFYVKLRIEANEDLRTTGNGRIYLGFHIDPIYKVEWNNLGAAINYAIKVPRGSAISPSINEAKKVTSQATDSDPREFLLEARKWMPANPISITVNYSVHSPSSKRNYDISQHYIVYLEHDPFAGEVFGRQLPVPIPPGAIDKGSERYNNLLRDLDIDRDGKVSRDEAPYHLLRNWNAIDANHDGYMDASEYIHYREANR